MEFEQIYLSQPVVHDENACKAWRELQSLSYRARYYDMVSIAIKYNTTPQEMKEHKHCYINSYARRGRTKLRNKEMEKCFFT